jgi:cell division septum initiation protein DivIVA
MSADDLARQAADHVRDVIAEAERAAAEIIERAESEAAQIRERAESEARDKLERARRALSELAGETPGPQPPPVPDPTPPAPAPPPEPPAPAANSHGSDDSAARLMAMKMALDGKARDQIATELNQKLGDADRGALLDDVLTRAGR